MRHLRIFSTEIVITLITVKVRRSCQINRGTTPTNRIFDAAAVFAYAKSSGQEIDAGGTLRGGAFGRGALSGLYSRSAAAFKAHEREDGAAVSWAPRRTGGAEAIKFLFTALD